MSDNKKLHDILRCTDNETIERIAEKYTLSDEETSKRVYERCVKKMMAKKDENSGYSEVFTAEKHKRKTLFRMTGLLAACIAIIGGVIIELGNIKPPVHEKAEEAPVFSDATSTTAVISINSGTKVTAAASKTAKNNSVTTTVKASTANTAISEKATQAEIINVTTTSETISSADKKEIYSEILSRAENDERLNADSFIRAKEVVNGNYPADSPRLSYDEVLKIAANSDTQEEFMNLITQRQPYPDESYGQGIKTYWFDDERTEGLSKDDRHISIFNAKTYHHKDIFVGGEIRKIEQVKEKEKEMDCYFLRERYDIINHNINPSNRYTLDEYKKFAEESNDFSEFWEKSSMYIHTGMITPEKWDKNEPMTFIYNIADDYGYILVDIKNAYAKYINDNTPQKSMYLIKDKGTLDVETINNAVEMMNLTIEYTNMQFDNLFNNNGHFIERIIPESAE